MLHNPIVTNDVEEHVINLNFIQVIISNKSKP